MEWWTAVILGIVEGLTEFLPVSSTGHLIVTGHLLGFTGEMAASFEIAIQLGAILAVMFYYRKRLLAVITTFPKDEKSHMLIIALGCAFLPAAIIGLATHSYITEYLFNPKTVAGALIIGGITILVIERTRPQFRIHDISELRIRDAILIGFAQCLALFPGVSRSGATIMGGLMIGLDRKTATEFSFLLALPTMLAATGYQMVKSQELLFAENIVSLGIGMVVAFFTALAVIDAFLKYITTKTFVPFAYYRIAFGTAVLYLFW
ncbi:MAG: undecaprenyl-diphosphatase [Nitrospiraceae bacterium]|jgi:undecaprenyl-diphosphatase|nr:undecaprenyl-diphosphatase [Nitrospiraceae bacterium]|tara:strand:- start:3580 stop:4368 length:789 start_codon:yes stop_codon:yes gene_type:complete